MTWFNLSQIIPFYPLYKMIRVQLTYGVLKLNKWHLFLIWITKLIIFEPFRILEAIVMAFLPEKEIQPIFILGFYRSGTTYLQELLSANNTHATLTLFQSVVPEVSLCFSWIFKPVFTIIVKLLRVNNDFHNIPFDWDFPGEEDVAINSSMAYYDYNRIYQYPSKYEKINKEILTNTNQYITKYWMANHRYLIKKLSYKTGKKTLVLKSPPNMARVPILLKMYPQAKFIFIHRNPFDCIRSTQRIWKLNQLYSFETYSDKKAKEIIEKQYKTFYYRYKSALKNQEICVVRFDELVAQSTKTIERIYSELSLQNWKESKDEVEAITLKRKKAPRKIEKQKEHSSSSFEGIAEIHKELGYH